MWKVYTVHYLVAKYKLCVMKTTNVSLIKSIINWMDYAVHAKLNNFLQLLIIEHYNVKKKKKNAQFKYKVNNEN